jgi:putative transcriptional regulator
MEPKDRIARLVRELRGKTGLTQKKFAAKLGVTFQTINRWENGKVKPSPLAMKQIFGLIKEIGEETSNLIPIEGNNNNSLRGTGQ